MHSNKILSTLGVFIFLLAACKTKKESIQYPKSDVLDLRTSADPYFTEEDGIITSIDVDALMKECIPIYLDVNVHWFLDDDCGDSYNLKDVKLKRDEAFLYSYNIIQDANDMWVNMADNKYYQSDVAPVASTPVCIPIQYVLRDVIVHCDKAAQKTNVGFRKFNKHVRNGDEFMNVFISNVSTASGFAGGQGHMMVVENVNAPLFNHEMGHNFSLMHAYINERSNAQTKNGCMDVYLPPSIKWDGDNDGKIDSNKPKGNCWNTNAGGDKNGNDVGDWCEGIYKDNPHPCCSWNGQDNNLMMSSAWANNPDYAAVTPCQVEAMMHHINEKKLKFVSQVGGCPPPSALIGQMPNYIEDSLLFNYCFHLEGSYNTSQYRLEILKDEQSIYESEWVIGEPEYLCLTDIKELNWQQKVKKNKTYTLVLSVTNVCGQEDEASYTFEG